MNKQELIFISTGLGLLILVLSYTVTMIAAVNILRAAYKLEGVDWSYWSNLTFRRRLFLDPESIPSEDDSNVISIAKKRLIRHRAKMIWIIVIGALIMAAGFASIILSAINE